ncbi:hypothetical protein [Singulisphaera acidiphila]|uniref:Uncharacterized protein n=1 Tax=Singulisphaera acidiphila (strain ATCC BAA-1392 / DSM 18658 / VKM B-2454 / MOB10) TaxID=886293 RepID=L0DET6_SINAD|nr:hypothetical protein [Singulisphaera acidiphila]AGA27864.1 hypothetical protein Sinac_3615 [Singulisphaera acidiphila DSM 18658]
MLGRASSGRPIWERLGIAVLPFLGCTVAWHWMVGLVFQAVASFWSKTSLAAAMGLAYGYKLSCPTNVGPIEDTFDGPLSALAYWPAVLLGHSGFQVLAVRGLSLFYYYGPAAWLLLRDGEGLGEREQKWRWGGPRLGSLLLFIAFVLLTTNFRSLRSSPTEMHADAPALALAASAVVLMVRGGGGQNPWTCSLALILAVLAVWGQQLAVPLLLIGLPAYALATGARQSLLRLLLPGFVGGLAITLILLAAFDPQSVGAASGVAPLRGKGWLDFLAPLIVFQEKHAPLLFLLAVGFVGRIGATDPAGSRDPSARFRRRDTDWIVFVVAGLAELVFSALGYFGPDVNENTMSFSLYFLSLGSLLMLKPLLDTGDETERRATPWGWYLVIGLNLMLAMIDDEALGIALVERKGAGPDAVVADRPKSLLPPCSPGLRVLNSPSTRA